MALSRLVAGDGRGASRSPTSPTSWKRRIENARRQASACAGRYLELRYEDLVADPESALGRVCELIELDYDPAMLGYHERAAAERIGELGDLPAEGERREPRPRRAPRRPISLAASAADQCPHATAWRREMSASRPGGSSRPSRAACWPSSATTCHPDRP